MRGLHRATAAAQNGTHAGFGYLEGCRKDSFEDLGLMASVERATSGHAADVACNFGISGIVGGGKTFMPKRHGKKNET